MKINEAKEIVSTILDWQFVLMGVKKRHEIKAENDLMKYSLSDLLKANQLVESNNKRKEKLQKYHTEKGHKSNGHTVNMIIAERAIAAVYTALHFSADGQMIALINDVGVGCVKADYSDE